ncbi:MAG TPA: hypothetical protein VEQ10_02855, partial [Vicinamibacteria bacterium]|nr:hypothetical protein [Vicinamibacteria bacterium]
ARRQLESWLSRATRGSARLGPLDLQLWKGMASVGEARLVLREVTIEARRVDAAWSPRFGLAVRLVRPLVVVRDTGEERPREAPASGLATQPWRVLEKLGPVEVVEGRLDLRDAKGTTWLLLGRVDLEARPQGRRRAVHLRVADAAAGWPSAGVRVKPVRVEADVLLDDGRLSCTKAQVTTDSSLIDVHGTMARISPITAEASADASFDASIVGRLAPGTELAGRVDAQASVQVDQDRVSGTVGLAAPALAVFGVGPWVATGRGRFEGGQLVLDSLVARGFGGRLQASGRLALAETARTELRARLDDLEVAPLAGAVSGTRPPVATVASARLRWETTGWDIPAARGDGRLALRPAARRGLPVGGAMALHSRGLTLGIEEARLEARGALLAGAAELRGRDVAATWSAELPLPALPALFADLGLQAAPTQADGRLRFEGRLGGPASAPVVSAHVSSEDLSVRGWGLGLEARADYADGRLTLAPLVLRSGAGTATVAGGVPALPTGGEWDLAAAIERFDLGHALGLAGIAGQASLSGTLRASGPRHEPATEASLRAQATLAGSPGAVTLALEARSRGRVVDVSRLSAEIAGGRVELKGHLDTGTAAVSGEAKAEGLQWSRLPFVAAEVPALQGTLGGTASVSGTTRAPSGRVTLTLASAAWGGAALPDLSTELHADGHTLGVTAAAPRVFLRGEAPLEGAWPLHVEIDPAGLPLEALLDGLAGSGSGSGLTASGRVAADVSLHSPADLRYSATELTGSGRLKGVDWTIAPFSVRGDRESLQIEKFRLAVRDTWVTANGRVALQPSGPFDLAVDGHLDAASLEPVLPGGSLGGDGDLHARARGALSSPELSGGLRLSGLRGEWHGARWSDVAAEARLTGHELQVDSLQGTVLGGHLSAKGAFPLLRGKGAALPRLLFEWRDLDIARLLGPQ